MTLSSHAAGCQCTPCDMIRDAEKTPIEVDSGEWRQDKKGGGWYLVPPKKAQQAKPEKKKKAKGSA